jgi:hypothetical protein
LGVTIAWTVKHLATAILIGMFVSAYAEEPFQVLPSPAELHAAIDREGPRAVLWDRLFADARGPAFDPFLTRVESGDSDWLGLAARLKPVSDAGVSLMLDQAVAAALPRAPDQVLGIAVAGDVAGTFSLRVLCSGRVFLVDEPRRRVFAWFEKTERALLKLRATNLAAKRTECLSHLRDGREKYIKHGVVAK